MNDFRVRQKGWRGGGQFLSLGIESLGDSLGVAQWQRVSYNKKHSIKWKEKKV